MPITRKDIPVDEMPMKIPDEVLLRFANTENGKLRAYITELEDKIERMKKDAFSEIGIDSEWFRSRKPSKLELKAEILRLGSIIVGKRNDIEKEVQSLRKRLSVLVECGTLDDVYSAIANQKVLSKRVSKLEKENYNLKIFIRENGLNYNTVIDESTHP